MAVRKSRGFRCAAKPKVFPHLQRAEIQPQCITRGKKRVNQQKGGANSIKSLRRLFYQVFLFRNEDCCSAITY
jgi:hypothetical protein